MARSLMRYLSDRTIATHKKIIIKIKKERDRKLSKLTARVINRQKRPENIRDFFSVSNSTLFEINITFLKSKLMFPILPIAHGLTYLSSNNFLSYDNHMT